MADLTQVLKRGAPPIGLYYLESSADAADKHSSYIIISTARFRWHYAKLFTTLAQIFNGQIGAAAALTSGTAKRSAGRHYSYG